MPTIPKLTENVLPAFPSPEYSFIQCLPQNAIISTASVAVVNASTPIRMAITGLSHPGELPHGAAQYCGLISEP